MACGDFDSATSDGEKIKILNCLVKELRSDIDNLSTATDNFNGHIGQSNNILGDMLTTVKEMSVRMLKFTTDFKAQYKLAERIAQSYKKTSLQIGLSVGRSKDLSDQFKGAVANVARFGGELSDVEGIYSDFADASGRARILGEDEVTNIFKLSKAANLYGSEATNLYEVMDLMGVSNVAATERMQDLMKDSQKIGLNSSKVVKVLANNMKSMQSYSFSSGVKGMTEMAKLGVKLRMDVSSMLGMAEKFYQPEAAIEAAANLQMLGGDIAEAFGDPFETMYLARNKPEELAKKLGDMTENMMTFNSETKEYEFPAEARMQLKAAGEQLGFNTDQMIEMARQTSKMKDVKDKLSMSGMFSKEEMEGISSMARLEDGEFKVDFRDEQGETVTKTLDELMSEGIGADMVLKTPTDEQDYMSDMLYNSQTTNEHLSNIEDSFQKGFVSDVVDVYQLTESMTNKGILATEQLVSDMSSAAINAGKDYINKFFPGAADGNIDKWAEEQGDKIGAHIERMNIFGDDTTLDVNDLNATITNLNILGSTGTDTSITGKHATTKPSDYATGKDIMSMPGGDRFITGDFGAFSIDNRDLFIAGKPQNLLGGNNANNNIKIDPMTITINGDLSVNMPDGATERVNIDFIKPQIVKLIQSHLNGMAYNGGKPAGNGDGADMVLNS